MTWVWPRKKNDYVGDDDVLYWLNWCADLEHDVSSCLKLALQLRAATPTLNNRAPLGIFRFRPLVEQ